MRRAIPAPAAILVLVFLSSCSLFFPPKVETLREGIGLSYSTITGLANGATRLIDRDQLDPEQGAKILEALTNAIDLTDVAAGLEGRGETDEALYYLDAATQILDAIQALLANYEGGEP